VLDDRTFKLVVIAGAIALIAGLSSLRFCSDVTLPDKPPAPRAQPADQLLAATDASPRAWRGYVERDAIAAGIPLPTPKDMSRRLPFRVDESHHTLEPGAAPIDLAGLRVSAQLATVDGDDLIVLSIENLGSSYVAYRVVTRPNVSGTICAGRSILPHNGMVIAPHATERRSECVFRRGMYLHVDRVDAVDLPPLPALYVSRVPPAAVGAEPRLALGHRPALPRGVAVCNVVASRSVAAGLENGTLGWRDLIDFYARHRCDTYQFPDGYRAFSRDGEKPLPVVR
jgi:hypothetical protein